MLLMVDRWIHQPLVQLDGRSAYEISQQNPEDMMSFLLQYKIPALFPLDYLLKRLNITTQTPFSAIVDPESVTEKFFDLVIARRWDELYAFYPENTVIPDAKDHVTAILKNVPELVKCKSHYVINCGLANEQNTAFVYLELNNKHDWTLVLKKDGEKWLVRQHIKGTPRDYFAQNDLFTKVATEMAKAEFEQAEKILYRIKDIYPDTADIHYYYGIYHQWAKQDLKARDDYMNAAALDGNWVMPLLHLGLIYMADQKYDLALNWFKEADRIEPANPVVLNNLGACLYGMGEREQARKIWSQAVELQPDFKPAKQNLDLP